MANRHDPVGEAVKKMADSFKAAGQVQTLPLFASDEIIPRDVLLEMTVRVFEAVSATPTMHVGTVSETLTAIYDTLASLGNAPLEDAGPPPAALQPAVPVKKSITPDYLICLDDGTKHKAMKRHLGILGMTPDEYRAKWGLKPDYPMVAPNYAAARREIALKAGLGKKKAV